MTTREVRPVEYESQTGIAPESDARRPVLHLCGINHTRAPLSMLERFALDPEASRRLLRRLVTEAGAVQALVLSTCNRTELYAYSNDSNFGAVLREIMLEIGEQAAPGEGGAVPLYEYRGMEAVRHLFAVESGLDSMILGENYIKAQVRLAWEASRRCDAAGSELNRLVQAALRCGKRIRTETQLNVGTLEVDIAAIMKGEQVLGTLQGRVCLVIGAGKIGRRAAIAIAERRPARLIIVNRTVETAREIAGSCGAEAYGLDELSRLLPLAEFVLGAAYTPEFVIRREAYEASRSAAGAPPRVCLVDTAVPRIFDPALAEIDGMRLFDIEQMRGIVELNRNRRVRAAQEGWRIVEEELEQYRQALLHAELAPAIQRLRGRFDQVFKEERDTLESLAGNEADCRKLEAIQHRIKQRLLHEVIVELKTRVAEQG